MDCFDLKKIQKKFFKGQETPPIEEIHNTFINSTPDPLQIKVTYSLEPEWYEEYQFYGNLAFDNPSTVGAQWIIDIKSWDGTRVLGNGAYTTGPNGAVIEIRKDKDSEGIIQYFIRCIEKTGIYKITKQTKPISLVAK